ncbi:17527_t:CDS:2, partial [Funneliformis geosporum]
MLDLVGNEHTVTKTEKESFSPPQELEKEVSKIIENVNLKKFRISRLLKTKKGVDYYLIIDQGESEEFQEQDKYHCFEKSISKDTWKKMKELRSKSSLELFYRVAKGEYQNPDDCSGYHNKQEPRNYNTPHICSMCYNPEK